MEEPQSDAASYEDRLRALHADENLMNRVKNFIHDLMVFGKDEGARLRLVQDPTATFYMSSVYFTPAHDGSTSSYTLCTSHDLAPVFQAHLGVSKHALLEAAHSGLYNKFAKELRKQQRKNPPQTPKKQHKR